MGRPIICVFAAALACGAAPAHATDADANADSAEPIVVTGQSIHYGVRATSTATKTNTAIRDVPQALTTAP